MGRDTHTGRPSDGLCKWRTLICIYYWFSCDFFIHISVWARARRGEKKKRNLVSISTISTMFEHSKRAFICKYWTRKKSEAIRTVRREKKWNVKKTRSTWLEIEVENLEQLSINYKHHTEWLRMYISLYMWRKKSESEIEKFQTHFFFSRFDSLGRVASEKCKIINQIISTGHNFFDSSTLTQPQP